MALETLRDVKEIDGFAVERYPQLRDAFNPCNCKYIIIHEEDDGVCQFNDITFKLQKGPIKEVGVNGCQVDTLIEAAKLIIEGFQKQFPCRENAIVITKLDEALLWLLKRKLDREKRAVEGTSQA